MRSKITSLTLLVLVAALFSSLHAVQAESRRAHQDVVASDGAPTISAEASRTELAGGRSAMANANNSFSRKVAGTYLDTGEVAGGPFTGMQTLGADGTQTATNNNCCGFGGGAYDNLQGPAHGAWVRTGQDQVTINSVIQLFMLDGTPFITARVSVVVDFLDDDYNTADAALQTELFFWAVPGGLPGPDVQNDAPALTLCGTASWARLQVVSPTACP